jgi:hypothetical protein
MQVSLSSMWFRRMQLRNHARPCSLALVAVLLVACNSQGSTVQVMPAPQAPADPCKIGITHLGAFTQEMAADIVTARSLLVAATFDFGATAKAVKAVSATLKAYPELEASLQRCKSSADLAQRVATLRGSAETIIAPSLATVISEGQTHWEAANGLVGLLPQILALSEAAKVAGDPLNFSIAVATDPAGANPPSIPPGPFAQPPAEFAAFEERIGRRGPEFDAMLTTEGIDLRYGDATELRRIGRRISIFSDTEVKWLDDHPALPCYAAYWKVLRSVWTKLSAAGQAFVSGSMSSARTSAVGAQTKLDTLYDRDYVTAATRACVVAPAP